MSKISKRFIDLTSSTTDQLDAADLKAIHSATNYTAANAFIDGHLSGIDTKFGAIANPLTYQGNWNASTNTPSLSNGTGTIGHVYRVSVAGTVDFGAGNISFVVGDKAVYNTSGVWEKWDVSDEVVSVNGQTGVVVLDTDDIAEGANLYFTDERAQDAVGTILVDSANIDLTYSDGTPSITADLIDTAVTPGSYGSASQVGTFTVDAKGRLTAAANASISITSAAVSDFNEAAQDAVGGALTDGTTIDFTYNDGANTISAEVLAAPLITSQTAETVADNADLILIYDNSATAARKMTRANFLSGVTGKILEQEILTLNGTDITNGYKDLAVAAYSADSISVTPKGGPLQEQGVDYTVALTGGVAGVTRITFAGDLSANLVSGDKLIIYYEV